MQRARGCHEDGKNITLLGKEKLSRCPLRFVRDDPRPFNRLARLYRFMEAGFLPEAGGINDQSTTFIDYMDWWQRGISEANTEKQGSAPGA